MLLGVKMRQCKKIWALTELSPLVDYINSSDLRTLLGVHNTVSFCENSVLVKRFTNFSVLLILGHANLSSGILQWVYCFYQIEGVKIIVIQNNRNTKKNTYLKQNNSSKLFLPP